MNVARLSQAGRKRIASFRQKKFREAEGLCVVEGRRSVESLLAAGVSVREAVVTDELASDPVVAALAESGASVWVAAARDFERMSDVATSQGILAVAETAWSALETVCRLDRVVALDGVQDPGNVGAIIRSAAWFGVTGVLCGPGVADCYGPKVLRSSMGAIWDVLPVRSASLPRDLDVLRTRGFAVYAADLDGEPLDAWEPSVPSCLVLGSEAHGVSPDIMPLVGARVRIPGRGKSRATESLNVAVAAGILLSRWTGTA